MILKWVIAIFLAVIILYACEKIKYRTKIYKIPKGKHHSGLSMHLLRSDGIHFECTFDKSAIYENVNPTNQYDVNKLMGFSDCNSHHHENSARFGWRWLNGSVEILAYVYNDSIRLNPLLITTVEPNETHDYQLWMEDTEYIFKVDDIIVKQKRTSKCDIGVFYQLYPYFGGDETAPHDIRLKIKEFEI